MGKYEIRKLNMNGQPEFAGKSRIIEDTESKMFIQLAKELQERKAWGYFIYQSNNRSGLKIRYLFQDGDTFVVKNNSGKAIEKFRLSAPRPQPKPKTTAQRPATRPAIKNGIYRFSINSEEPRYRMRPIESGNYATLKEAYAEAYKILKKYNGKPVSATFDKTTGMLLPGRVMSYHPWYQCIVLSVYGKNMNDFRVYSDGRLKKLTRADIVKKW